MKQKKEVKKPAGTVKAAVTKNVKPPVVYSSINQYIIYGIIAVLTFILYSNTISHDYALDDSIVVTDNVFTQKGLAGIHDILAYDSFKGDDEFLNAVSGGRYRPLSIVTFAIEHQYFGKNPHISHFIEIILYALCGIFLYIILFELFRKKFQTHWYLSIPFMATLLFIAHPIHTEVVANIKSRDELMAFLFSLIAMFLIIKYLDTGKMLYLILSPIIFFLALLSKETAITFIVIIPLAFYFFTPHTLKKIISTISPLVATGIFFIILRQIIIHKTDSNLPVVVDLMNDSFAKMNGAEKYATIMYTLGLYVKLLFYPHPLTWDYYPYHIPIMEWSKPLVLLSLLVYVFLSYVAIKGLKKKTFFSFCFLVFLIPLSLTSNILFPIGAFMSERFLFVSTLGFTLFIAYLMSVKPDGFSKVFFKVPYLILVPVLCLYSFKTIDRNKAWKNTDTLVRTDIKVSYNSGRSTDLYGTYLFQKVGEVKDPIVKNQKLDSAIFYFDKAFSISPQIQTTNYCLGTIYGQYKNDQVKSQYYLNNSMNLNPKHIQSYNNLGISYAITKQFDKALEVFNKGLLVAPNDSDILNNLSLTYNLIGDQQKAAYYLKQCKEIGVSHSKKK